MIKRMLLPILLVFAVLAQGEVFCGRDASLPAADELEQAWTALVKEGNLTKARELFEAIDPAANAGASLFMGLETVYNFGNRFDESLPLACQGLRAARTSPWAEIFLYDVCNLRSISADWTPVYAVLEETAEASDVSSFLRDYARFELAAMLRDKGDFKKSDALFTQMQFITRGRYCGPFSNRDGSGFEETFPPENTIDFAEEYPGINRSVGWMPYETPRVDGYNDYAAIFYPYENSVGYGLYSISVPEAGAYRLHAGTGNSIRIWINYEEVFATDDKNGLFFDRHVMRVNLLKGANLIVVKLGTTNQDNEWGLFLRLSDTAGNPVRDLQSDFPDEEKLGSAVFSGRKQPAEVLVTPAETLFRQAMQAAPKNSMAPGTLGFVYSQRRTGDRTRKENLKLYNEAFELAPKCPLWGELAGAVDDNINKTLQVLEGLVAQNPDALSLKQEICSILKGRGFNQQFEAKSAWFDEVDEKLAARIMYLKANLYRERKWYGEAQQLLRKAAVLMPHYSAIQKTAALNAISEKEEMQYLQRLLQEDKGDIFTLKRLGDMARRRGDLKEARKYYEQIRDLNPTSTTGYYRLLTLFKDRKEYDKALKLLDHADEVFPQYPGFKAARAKVHMLAGREEEGQAHMETALGIDPNLVALKEYMDFLQPEKDSFYKAWDYDGLEALKKYRGDAAYPRFNVVDIANVEVVAVNKNGTENRMMHRTRKVLTEAGIRWLSQVAIPYSSARSRVEVKFARIIKPDGQIVQTNQIRDHSGTNTSSGGAVLYSSYLRKVITFPGLEKGDIVDFEYVIEDTSSDMFTDQFSDMTYLAATVPTEQSRYIISLPPDMKLQVGTYNTDIRPEISKEEETGRLIYTWDLKDWPGMEPERSMRPLTEYLPQLVVSTMGSWKEVGNWYYHLAKKQFHMDAEMKTRVAELIKDKQTDTDKLRAIFRYVIDEIRYVGIEFGRNSLKPHRAQSTFTTRYGDCKDTAVLFVALLKEAGIDSNVVLVRTATLGDIDKSVASPFIFNHAICVVPDVDGKEYWLDGTTDFYKLEEVPWADQEAVVLVVAENGSRITTIPREGRGVTGSSSTARVDLRPDGSAVTEFKQEFHGQYAPVYRTRMNSKDQFAQGLQRFYSRKFPGANITKTETSSSPEIISIPWYVVSAEVGRYALAQGNELLMAASLNPLSLSRGLMEKERKFDLWLRFRQFQEEKITIKIPEGYKVKFYPEDKEFKTDNAEFTQTTVLSEDHITCHTRFAVFEATVKPADYAAHKAFCGKVDSAYQERIILERK